MEILFVLLVVLVIITLVGHGIWAALAWLLRGGRPRYDIRHLEPTVAEDRAAAARYLGHLRSREFIDPQTHSALMQAMAEEARSGKRVPAHLGKLQASMSTQTLTPPSTLPPRREEPPSQPVPVRPSAATEMSQSLISPRDLAMGAPDIRPPVPLPPTTAPKPAGPRRPFGGVLSGFMAEKNIRWGELVGGLLILCCSTALVISLWSQIQAIPVLKFVIFTGVTGALFGVGLFVHHRWRLPTTGHAVLIVSSLLVPLNMLAFAAFSRGVGISGLTAAIELTTVLLFAVLTLLAGRVVVPESPKLFAGGIVGLSAYSLLIRLVSPETGPSLLATALPPAALYLAVMAIVLWRDWRVLQLPESRAKRLILQLGVQTFACVAPLGFAAFEWGEVVPGLRLLSPLICALAGPALITGVFLSRRLAREAAQQLQVAGLSIALIAAAVLLVGAALAWPQPAELLPVLLVNAAAMAMLAWLTRHVGFHAAAAVFMGFAWALAVHLLTGQLPWRVADSELIFTAAASVQTGQALLVPFLACLAAAEWLRRLQRRELIAGYTLISGAFSVISLILITWLGFARTGDPQHVTWIYLVYAAAAFAVAWRVQRSHAVWAGCVLVQMALIQALVYIARLQDFPWPTALLVGGAAAAAVSIVLRVSRLRRAAELYCDPLAHFAIAVCTLAAIWLLMFPTPLVGFSVRAAIAAMVLGAVAAASVWPVVFAGSQLAAMAAVVAVTQHWLQSRTWFPSISSPLLEPWVWQAHLLVVTCFCLFWAVLRRIIGQPAAECIGQQDLKLAAESGLWRRVARNLLDPPFPATDRWITALLLIAVAGLSIWGAQAGIAAEHGLRPLALSSPMHTQAAGAGSWLLLTGLMLVLLLHLSEGFQRSAVIGLLVALACATILLADQFEAKHVVAVFRWSAAATFLLVSSAFCLRRYWVDKLLVLLRCRPGREPVSPGHVWAWVIAPLAVPAIALVFSALPVISGTPSAAVNAFWIRLALLGPASLIALGLFAHGVSERQAGYAVAAAVLAAVLTTAVELSLLPGRRPVTLEIAIYLVQLNAMILAGVAMAWRGAQLFSRLPDYSPWPMYAARVGICTVLLLAMVMLWLRPQWVPATVRMAGSIWGLIAFLAVEIGLLIQPQSRQGHLAGTTQTVWMLFGTVLLGCAAAPLDTGNWLCFHVLLVGFAAASCLRLYAGERPFTRGLGTGWLETFETASARAGGAPAEIKHDLSCSQCGYNLRGLASLGRCPECGANVAGALATALERLTPQWAGWLRSLRLQTVAAVLTLVGLCTAFALRAAVDDPQRPWWSAAALAAMAGVCLATAAWGPRRPLAYLGGVEMCLAASIWWTALHGRLSDCLRSLVDVNVIALAIAAGAWLLLEWKYIRRQLAEAGSGGQLPFHHAAAVLSTAAVVCTTAAALAAAVGQPLTGGTPTAWPALAATAGLMIACRLDPEWRYTPVGLYVLGLASTVRATLQVGLNSDQLVWGLSLALAGYVLLTSLVWRLWGRSRADRGRQEPTSWLLVLNAGLAIVSLVLCFLVSITDWAMDKRLLIAAAPLFCALGALIAAAGSLRVILQTWALALCGTAAIILWWAWVSPDQPGAILERAVRLLAVVAGTTILASAVRARLASGNSWTAALRWYAAGSYLVAGVALAYVAGCEAWSLVEHPVVPLGGASVMAMILALAAGIVCYLAFAAVERWDPLGLSGNARRVYVYLAEALAGVLTVHIRATMPWLFSGVISQYWPMLVIGVALLLLAAGELCQRRGRPVLADPFVKTGVLLPVVTLLDLMLGVSRVHFSIVLLAMGAFYALAAALRRSPKFSLVSGLALTGSLWYLLHQTPGLGITHHPQLWFIPPALAVLLAAHLCRDSLQEKQRQLVHYGCMLTVYLSSTADVFLIGVARAPWLPLVLAGLAVAGVLVGAAGRLRSFLFGGIGFLCLAMLMVLWHAATDLGWTWLWYVTGIVLGMAILVVFALFEKKRREMTVWLDQLRTWAK